MAAIRPSTDNRRALEYTSSATGGRRGAALRGMLVLATAVLLAPPRYGTSLYQPHQLHVSRVGDSYRVRADAYLNATPAEVYAVLGDFGHWTRINPSIRTSRVLKTLASGSTLIYTKTRLCVAFFCHTLRQVQEITEPDPRDIVAVTLPGQSNVKHGSSSWHLKPQDGGTRLIWDATIEPGFWVPPWIGPRIIKDELRRQCRDTLAGIERLVQERRLAAPGPAP